MIQILFLTKNDIVKAQKKLLEMHNIFKKPIEQEVAIDFANCLKKRLKEGTAKDFLKSCDNVVSDLVDETKVPEVYDTYTIGVAREMVDTFAEKLFGRSFAKEVRQFMDVSSL